MALLSLTNGLVWRDSGLDPGHVDQVEANFGTLGSVPQWRRQRYTLDWGPVPDPELPAFNRLVSGAQWRKVANSPGPPIIIQPGTPQGPLNFQPPGQAATAADVAASAAAAQGLVSPEAVNGMLR